MDKAAAEKMFFDDTGWGNTVPPDAGYVYQYTGTLNEGESIVSVATRAIHQYCTDNEKDVHTFYKGGAFWGVNSIFVVMLSEQATIAGLTELHQIDRANRSQ